VKRPAKRFVFLVVWSFGPGSLHKVLVLCEVENERDLVAVVVVSLGLAELRRVANVLELAKMGQVGSPPCKLVEVNLAVQKDLEVELLVESHVLFAWRIN